MAAAGSMGSHIMIIVLRQLMSFGYIINCLHRAQPTDLERPSLWQQTRTWVRFRRRIGRSNCICPLRSIVRERLQPPIPNSWTHFRAESLAASGPRSCAGGRRFFQNWGPGSNIHLYAIIRVTKGKQERVRIYGKDAKEANPQRSDSTGKRRARRSTAIGALENKECMSSSTIGRTAQTRISGF